MRPQHALVSRRTISLAAAAMAAAGQAMTGAARTHASPASVSAAPPCATSQLVVWIDLPGNGTAGSTYYSLQFTNLGSRTCTLRGYPGVSAVDLAGRSLGGGAGRNSLQGVATVTLARGASRTAVLRVTDTGALPAAGCREAAAAGIRVYPPGQTASRVVPFPFQSCSRAGASNITTSAVGRYRVGE